MIRICSKQHEFTGKRCKICAYEYTRLWRERNKEYLKVYAKNYSDTHKTEIQAYSKRYREHNLELVKNKYRNWRNDNLELAREASRLWRRNNPDKQKKSNVNWRNNNQEHIAYTTRAYRILNADKVRETFRKWRNENREKVAIRKQNREAKKRDNGGKLPKNIFSLLKHMQEGKCACCSKALNFPEIDHIIPISRGGKNLANNTQLLNKSCNASKKDREPEEFMKYRGIMRWCEHINQITYKHDRELLDILYSRMENESA